MNDQILSAKRKSGVAASASLGRMTLGSLKYEGVTSTRLVSRSAVTELACLFSTTTQFLAIARGSVNAIAVV